MNIKTIFRNKPLLASVALVTGVVTVFSVVHISWRVADYVTNYSHLGNEGWSASSAAGQWAGALITLAGFVFVLFQLYRDKKELENHTKELASQTAWMVYGNGLTTLNVFVEHPHLRKYFYGDKEPVPVEDGLRNQVFAAAEMLLDHWESTFLSDELHDKVNELWLTYMIGVYCRSPALQEFLKHENEGYRYSSKFRATLSNKHCQCIEDYRAGKMTETELTKFVSKITAPDQVA